MGTQKEDNNSGKERRRRTGGKREIEQWKERMMGMKEKNNNSGKGVMRNKIINSRKRSENKRMRIMNEWEEKRGIITWAKKR